ncbi:beta-glucoside-specific PTS transporter subunit IIABC [Sodalis sp. RH21]|uniref:beta-glucoside-specific PTS transporter subunit IIABC n=1 Tax=unclassified Sodalis (in: enterobacteria) TaxID=2636512 RepID=UPI0039B49FC8
MSEKQDLAAQIINLVGGDKNIISLTHCITRLRFYLKDAGKFDKPALDKLDGVIMAVESNGQFQVVVGDKVATIYHQIIDRYTISGTAGREGETGARKGNPLARVFNTMSSILVPIVPALAGAGMLKAVLVILTTYHWLATDSSTYLILLAASNSVFYFLPLLLAFSCGKAFGTNPFVSVAIVAALLEPNFTAMIKQPGDIVSFLGIPVVLMKYNSTLIPAILAIWVYSWVERGLKRIIHQSIEMVAVPMLGLIIMVPLVAIVVGPIGIYAGTAIGDGIAFMNHQSGMLTGALIGAGWTFLVMFGLHWGLVPVMLNNLALHGYDTIKPPAGTATFAQAGAAFGVFLRARDPKLKSFALSAMLPALLAGVTEPIVYGISIKYKRPLVAATIAGVIAGGFVGAMNTTAMAYVFPSLTTLPAFMTATFKYYIAGIALSFVLSAALTFIMGFDEAISSPVNPATDDGQNAGAAVNGAPVASTTAPATPAANSGNAGIGAESFLAAPLNGRVIPLEQVKDPVFASGVMGQGIAIIPIDGEVYSPVDGIVSKLFHTRHAIGITSDQGVEVLIHIGLDTVRLNGELFSAHIREGDRVRSGDLLLTFDREELLRRHFDITTPVIIANSDDYPSVSITDSQQVETSGPLLRVSMSAR